MPVIPLQILPGIVTEATAKDAVPQWKDCNRIRFNRGTVENMKGWMKDSSTVLSGIARKINNWTTLSDDRIMGIGTHKKLYIWRGGTFYNITPLMQTGTLNNPFDTTITSTTVLVTDAAHGLAVGDTVIFSGAAAVGGITINGSYEVITVPTSGTYTITHSVAASSTVAAGGGASVGFDYEITIGSQINRPLLGWGASTWGASTWGTPRTSSGVLQFARLWSLDQWGEDLVACIRGGAIYTWDASAGYAARAAVISGAPSTGKFIIVSPEDRRLIVFGAHDGSASDPLLIRWCTSEDFTSFTPTTTNTAGDKRIDRGTELVGGVRTRGQIVFMTDSGAHSMYPSNDELVYGFSQLGEKCGLIAPNAVIDVNGVVYWMSNAKKFFRYDGVVREIDCPIKNHVFDDINLTQKTLFHCGTNSGNNEILFFYCSAASSEIDKYAKYNIELDVWDYGSLARTAWIDVGEGGGLETPYATGADGYLYQHEVGDDDDTSPLGSFIESHDMDITDGDFMMHVKKIYPDFVYFTGSLDLTLKTRDYPQSAYRTKGARTITGSTEYIALRARGRQIALRLVSSTKGDRWRAGKFRAQVIRNGRR